MKYDYLISAVCSKGDVYFKKASKDDNRILAQEEIHDPHPDL